MKRFAATALIMLFFVTGCATMSPDKEKEASFYYTMGVSALNEGNVQNAFVHFQKAYQLNPYNKEIMNSLGLVYSQLEENDKARDLFLKAIAEDPNFAEAHNNLGVTYMKMERWSDAVESFKRALANPLYPTHERAFYNMGMSYYRMGNYDGAINAFKDSLRRSPAFPYPYYGLALALNKLSRFGEAATAMTKAIEIDPAYKGNRGTFLDDMNERSLTAKGSDERDIRDYIEIMKY